MKGTTASMDPEDTGDSHGGGSLGCFFYLLGTMKAAGFYSDSQRGKCSRVTEMEFLPSLEGVRSLIKTKKHQCPTFEYRG